MSDSDYEIFLEKKSQLGGNFGFDPIWIPDFLFGFQKALVEFSINKGKSAIFADCGLGKTPIQLVWAENIVRHTNKPVLILTPLAVSHQTVREAEKFGIQCNRTIDGSWVKGINVTNYERLHYFNSNDFMGVVCDESSILKSFDGIRRGEITEFMKKVPYRLLCTATAAPNDFIELGTSSEALGELGHMDMLNRFFKNMNNTSDMKGHWGHRYQGQQWKFKAHSEIPFWQWVSSWAYAIRKPSDSGFDDDGFILPELIEHQHIVKANTLAPGTLFPLPAIGLKEQREERGRTIKERCEKVAELVSHDKPSLVWCQLNTEGDLLEKIIPDSKQVSGRDSDDQKEEKFLDFINGNLRVLVTKPKIGAWGLNLQHCPHVTFFPSHSFEQYYQGVRRCWRFGQKNPVVVDIITTEGEVEVISNLQRKAKAADQMFSQLISQMSYANRIDKNVLFTQQEEVPSWL